MRSFRSLGLAIIVVLIWTLATTDVTSAQQGQSGSAAQLLHDQLTNFTKGSPSKENLLCVVCAGHKNEVTQCRNVADVGPCIAAHSTRASAKRKKRHAYSFWRPFTWNNFPRFPRFHTIPPISGQGGPIICPQQVPQSHIYTLSADSANYPALDIAEELSNNLPLLDFLSQQVVLPGDPPPLVYEEFIQRSPYSCPFTELRVWSYYSPSASSRCWFLQTFQENLLYKNCSTISCQNSNAPSRETSPWHTYPNLQVVRNLCIAEYRQVSLWSYCPNLVSGRRIVSDRIIIPVACNCQSVRCSSS